MVSDQQRGPRTSAPWVPCMGNPTASLSKVLDWQVPQDPPSAHSTCAWRGSLSTSPLSGGSSAAWDPEALCAGGRPHLGLSPHRPTPGRKPLTWMLSKEALLVTSYSSSSAGGEGSEDLWSHSACPPPPPRGPALPAPGPLTPRMPAWGPGPVLTVGVTVVGVGDAAEPLLASRVPDLQPGREQPSVLPGPSQGPPAFTTPPPPLTCSFTFMPSTSTTLF